MHPTRFAPALLTFALLSAPVFAAPANDANLLAAARVEQPAVIQSLHDMVNNESGSDDTAGLQKMADYAERQLRGMGAATRMIPATNGEPPGLVEGMWKGTGKLRVMLIAHMDTVYRKGILKTEPYRREGNKLYGPGIADDKGGIAVILHSIDMLRKDGWHDFAQLTVLFNTDEEIGSLGSGQIIEKLGSQNDVVLSFEPSPSKEIAESEGVLLSAAGIASIKLTVNGRAAHAGAAPEQGRNALLELAHQLLQTREVAKSVAGAQLNWTTASAGTVRNQIPEHAEALSDVRITEPGAAEKLLTLLKSKVDADHLIPDTKDELSLDISRPMFVAGEKGMVLAKTAQSIYAELGQGNLAEESSRKMPGGEFAFSGRNLLLIPGTTGGTDAGFAARSGKPAVLEGFGLAGWGYHAKDEHIEIDSIVPRLYLTSRMLIELGRKADAGDQF